MKITSRALALPTAIALALTAGALAASAGNGPKPAAQGQFQGQPVVTALPGDAKAVTTWTDRPDGWQVVTTVDTVANAGSEAESHAVTRFSSTLNPGQSQEISLPQPSGAAQVLRVERQDDGLVVAVAAE